MKFLHEFLEYNNGTTRDNGWWKIDGDRLYNIRGGWHCYTPSPNDIIIEADSWDDVPMDYLLNNNAITGWIAPDGTFYGCDAEEHELIAERVLKTSETMLEDQGYVKIFRNPSYLIYTMRQRGYDISTYEFVGARTRLTDAQRITLEHKGFDVDSGKFLGSSKEE
jgi:hypothetical protein